MLTVWWISALWADAVEQLQNTVVIHLSSEQRKHFFFDNMPWVLVDSNQWCKT